MDADVADNRLPNNADPSSDHIDITGLSFANLRDRSDQAFVKTMRILLTEMEEPQDAVAGFQSSI
ncbi:hypothetical protein [Dactylosporangium matsuzakiense]|uniref:Uncharacterized protein n=1 Tax=Dactylosporangium matsuzakiense TaxID=53360 RepID=A0A9W6KSE7_9ACTN|nr:hypothetical protein [Dactylosporangium matsuzakiense]UWZ44637.1 hypothetical protein Dmats_46105 [Dactylosporangium matsuzakiense]GLL04644.1 hypothetical protein GCM10017581_063910 [Dactylosporangium matsuzakiense]